MYVIQKFQTSINIKNYVKICIKHQNILTEQLLLKVSTIYVFTKYLF